MGSINGGTTITIFGEYFDPNATEIEVLVGGEINMCPLYGTLLFFLQ